MHQKVCVFKRKCTSVDGMGPNIADNKVTPGISNGLQFNVVIEK